MPRVNCTGLNLNCKHECARKIKVSLQNSIKVRWPSRVLARGKYRKSQYYPSHRSFENRALLRQYKPQNGNVIQSSVSWLALVCPSLAGTIYLISHHKVQYFDHCVLLIEYPTGMRKRNFTRWFKTITQIDYSHDL